MGNLCFLLLMFMGCSLVSTQLPHWTCPSNYSASSSFPESIRELSAALINSSSFSLFHNTSSSSSASSVIYGMFQCRGDISFRRCFACVNDSLGIAMQQCPNSTSAHVQMEECHIRYDNQSGLFDGSRPDLSASPWIKIWNMERNPNDTYQNDILEGLLEVTGLVPFQPNLYAHSTQGVYAQAQCDGYLDQLQCSTCFGSIPDYVADINQSIAGQVYFGSCFYRYADYPFFNIPADVEAPAPSPSNVSDKGSSASIGRNTHTFCVDKEDRNSTNIVLDWKIRVEIIQGIARGLAYLHEDSQVHIIHRDIKPGNILLDNDLTLKIADFGLARLFNTSIDHVTTNIAGTIGYLSPEYAMHGQLTEKTDVYSFGVVTLEILSGRRNTDYTQPEEKQLLLEWAWKCYREGQPLQLLDPQLMNSMTPLAKEEEEERARVIHVAILCTQSSAIDRPSMSKVGQFLGGKNDNLDVPKYCPFSVTTSLDHLRSVMDTSSSISSTLHSSLDSISVSRPNFNAITR